MLENPYACCGRWGDVVLGVQAACPDFWDRVEQMSDFLELVALGAPSRPADDRTFRIVRAGQTLRHHLESPPSRVGAAFDLGRRYAAYCEHQRVMREIAGLPALTAEGLLARQLQDELGQAPAWALPRNFFKSGA